MKLIDKDAVLAEIENRIRACGNCYILDELTSLHRTFDSLEVKEVDFDAEWKRYFEHRGEIATVNVKHLAKHFFELGMSVSNKAQKGK